MKRFRDIIQDIKAPSTSDLWINNGELKYYTSNGWKAITGNGSSDVYVLPGNLQTTEGWCTTDVESISPNVTQEQLVEAGFTPEICRRLNAGEVIYMSGECAGFGNDALYPIQGIAPNSSPDLVPSRLCYCHYSSYSADGTANGRCFTTIKKQSSGQYLVDYIEV